MEKEIIEELMKANTDKTLINLAEYLNVLFELGDTLKYTDKFSGMRYYAKSNAIENYVGSYFLDAIKSNLAPETDSGKVLLASNCPLKVERQYYIIKAIHEVKNDNYFYHKFRLVIMDALFSLLALKDAMIVLKRSATKLNDIVAMTEKFHDQVVLRFSCHTKPEVVQIMDELREVRQPRSPKALKDYNDDLQNTIVAVNEQIDKILKSCRTAMLPDDDSLSAEEILGIEPHRSQLVRRGVKLRSELEIPVSFWASSAMTRFENLKSRLLDLWGDEYALYEILQLWKLVDNLS